jgi:hypothetical protein
MTGTARPRARMPAAMHVLGLLPRRLPMLVVILLASMASCSPDPGSLPPGSVLFQDDFARRSSGWPVRHTAQAILEYEQDHYTMLVLAPNTNQWGTPGLDVGSARIEVDALHLGGPEDNLFGLVCHYRDDANFTFLVASSDGFAGIGEYRDGERSLLSGGAMLPAESIAPRGFNNHLMAECTGDGLRLYVNGSLVAEAPAGGEASGDVGLITGTYTDTGVEIAFDNFSVQVP